MKYDFHVHSTFSDCNYSFDRGVKTAIANKVDFLGMVDHDTFAPVELANTDKYKAMDISIIGGVEISCKDHVNNIIAHVIGYGCDTKNKKLREIVETTMKRRNDNFVNIIKTINSKEDFNIDTDEITNSHPANSIYRPHIFEQLTTKGYDLSKNSPLFNKMVGKDGYINYNFEYFDYKETIDAVLLSGGIPILAHSFASGNFHNINDYLNAGIMGMEARHPFHSIEEENKIIEFCKANNLLITCGSDFHGDYHYRNAGIGDCSLDDEIMSPFIDVLKYKGII